MPETNLTKKTRVHYRWSREARALVLANRNASKHELSDLVTQLARMTGNPRFACRRFVSRLGGKWNLAYRSWTLPEEKRLLTLIENHSIADIVKTLRRTRHSIFSKLYELGANANMGRDWFSVYTLAQALHIRHATVQKWIDQGWLIARPIHIGKQRRLVIAADDFCRFCQQRAKDI